MKFSYEDLFNECNDAAWNFEFALLFLKNFVFYCRKITAYYCSVSESYRSKRSKKGEKFMLRQWIEIIGNNCKYLFYSIKDGDMWSEKYEKNEVYGTQLIKKRDLMSHLKDLVLFGIVWGLALWGWGGGVRWFLSSGILQWSGHCSGRRAMPGGMCLASMEQWVGIVVYLFCGRLRGVWGGIWISCGVVHCRGSLISIFQGSFW